MLKQPFVQSYFGRMFKQRLPLTTDKMPYLSDFSKTCSFLTGLACGEERWDDCTGIFINIKDPDRAIYKWVIQNQEDLINKRPDIRRILNLYSVGNAGKLEIATQEAINNGIRSGSPVSVKLAVRGKKLSFG